MSLGWGDDTWGSSVWGGGQLAITVNAATGAVWSVKVSVSVALSGVTASGAAGTVVATFSIAAAATSAVATVSSTDGADEIAEGDLLVLVVAAVGSSTAGSNLTALVELDGSADQDGVDVHSVAVLRGDHPGSVVA